MPSYSKIVYFKNWTDKDFTYKYDNQEQTFEAGQLYSLPAEIAEHFAHHLAVRECFRKEKEFLPADMMEDFFKRCFPGGTPDDVKRQGLPIDKVEITHGQATPASVAVENRTEADAQQEVSPPEPSVEDNKVLKKKPGRPKKVVATADAEYTK